ncbi:unnamed protein product [Urochloa humidicola]
MGSAALRRWSKPWCQLGSQIPTSRGYRRDDTVAVRRRPRQCFRLCRGSRHGVILLIESGHLPSLVRRGGGYAPRLWRPSRPSPNPRQWPAPPGLHTLAPARERPGGAAAAEQRNSGGLSHPILTARLMQLSTWNLYCRCNRSSGGQALHVAGSTNLNLRRAVKSSSIDEMGCAHGHSVQHGIRAYMGPHEIWSNKKD